MTYDRITFDLEQMGGVPCIRGMRIPVATVVGMVADGMSHEEILRSFPDLEAEDMAWHFDQAALHAEAATDGWYALLSNLDPAEVDAAGVLLAYKGQEVVERRYGNFKGPLAVAPMFLQNNRRIESLISVICLALLVFALVERALRLAVSPALVLAGLWAGRAAKPTGRLIFSALSGLRLVPATATQPATIPEPPPLQARILRFLNVDATRPR